MADSINVFPPSLRVTDADGNPVAGAKLKFFEAGTSTPLTVYSDDALTTSLGTVVHCDSAGYPVTTEGGSTKTLIYAGTTDYKLTITDADDVTIAEHDDNPGALDTSGFAVTSAAPSMPVVTRATSSWSVASDAPGTLYRCNVAGSSQTVSFPSAVTAGDGYLFGLQYDGLASSNTVTYQAVAGQTIADGADAGSAAGTLTEHGQTKWFVSDGAGWRVAFAKQGRLDRGLMIVIADRLTAPPTSPTAGARYIINGTPSGTWAALGFAENDIVEANGQGGWIQYNPEADSGWIAFVQDEDVNYQYQSSGWVSLSNITAPATSYVPTAIFRYQQTSGTAGGTATQGSWQTYPIATFLNSGASNVISGAALASNKISGLPVGRYKVDGGAVFYSTDRSQLRLYNVTTSTEVFVGAVGNPQTDGSNYFGSAFVDLCGEFEVTDAAHEYRIDYQVSRTKSSDGLGKAGSWGTEVYGTFVFSDAARVQGPQGAQGAQGSTGRDAGHWRYTFSTADTSETDPGSGAFKLDNGTVASVTELYISATDADSGDADAFWSTVDDSTSTIKGQLVFRKASTPGTFLILDVDGAVTDNTGWWTVPVAYNSGALPSNSDSMLVTFLRSGDDGAAGSAGSDGGLPYTYSSSTDTATAPGAGLWRGNNASLASVTEIAVDDESAASGNPDLSDYLNTWGDSSSTVKGVLLITKASATENFAVYNVTGLTDGTGFVQLAVTHIDSAGTISNTDSTRLIFLRNGDKGDTGNTGATGATGPNTGLDYAWATATSGDPGSGKVLANNATLSSATALHISKTGRNSESLGAVLATWDDSTNTAHYGHLRVFTVADRTEYIEAEITGTLTDNSTYYTVPVSVTAANGTPSADDVMAVMFERTGNKGADGAGSGDVVGPSSSVDGEIALYDSTTGKLLKRASTTGLLKASSGVLAQAVADTDYSVPATLASTSNGDGAALIGIEDSGGYYTGTTVEAALSEIGQDVAALEGSVVLKGTWDASGGSFPGSGAAQAGWSYIVSTGGTVDSVAFTANDRIVAITDNASTSTYAANWHKLDYTDAVLSVAGRTGAVTIAASDITDSTAAGRTLLTAADAATQFSTIKQAASDSATGVVELATAAETTTGTDTARAITPDALAGSDFGKTVVSILVFDDSEDVATGDGAGDIFWRVPSVLNGANLVGVAACVQTAGTTGTTDVQIHNVTQTADMLTTKITIDSGETDSSTAAVAAVIDTGNDDVATGDRIRIDVDAVSTTAPKGLLVELTFQKP